MDGSHPIICIIIFIILLIMTAVVNGMNIALSSLSENELEEKAGDGDEFSGRLLETIRNPSRMLKTADVAVLLFTMITAFFAVVPASAYLADVILNCTGTGNFLSSVIAQIIICLLAVLLIYTAGFLLPQRLAVKYYEKWTHKFYGFMNFLKVLLSPFTGAATVIARFIIRTMGIDPKEIEENVTEEEIYTLVSEGHEQGVIEASEAEMINNILEFDDKTVDDIMTHRMNVSSVDSHLTVDEAARIIAGDHFSRYPVYEEDTDVIVGVVFLKDIMRACVRGDNSLLVRDVMRKPYLVPDTQSISQLLGQMQREKIHMGIVVDEYGQFSGVISMEDILEEIVGNIMDEYDHEEDNIQKMTDGYIVRGLTELDELGDVLGIDFDDEFDTLNGFMISQLDRIPRMDEKSVIEYKGYTFTVVSVGDNMIGLVKIRKLPVES